MANTKKEGPSRHARSSASRSGWFGGDWTDEEIRALQEREASKREESDRAAKEEQAKKIRGRDDLEQDLAMLLGGRRLGYAASQMEYENPYTVRARAEHTGQVGGHGGRTYSEQFSEPADAGRTNNAEENFLVRERDRLDPYGAPTQKMRVQEAAKQRIIDEWKRRGSR